MGTEQDVKLVAFYLPQFHRIPENDRWWGEGFTEWTNVRSARPLFKGHAQPRVPAGGWYYDLTDPDVRERQAHLAIAHGIDCFCYYHYWFRGRRLLEKPFDQVLASGRPEIPFCLAWANEPWTRAWSGQGQDVLMPQEYGDEKDWAEHWAYLRRAFLDRRYLRVDSRPVFLVYRAGSIPRCGQMLGCWRTWARRDGVGELFLIDMMTVFRDGGAAGFDARLEFEPMYTLRHDIGVWTRLWRNTRHRLRPMLATAGLRQPWLMDRYDYAAVWERIVNRQAAGDAQVIPGAFVDWDNTPRRGYRGTVMTGARPEIFERYLGRQLERTRRLYGSRLLFINAWNEWAEGAYLEPDELWGMRWIEAIRRVRSGVR